MTGLPGRLRAHRRPGLFFVPGRGAPGPGLRPALPECRIEKLREKKKKDLISSLFFVISSGNRKQASEPAGIETGGRIAAKPGSVSGFRPSR